MGLLLPDANTALTGQATVEVSEFATPTRAKAAMTAHANSTAMLGRKPKRWVSQAAPGPGQRPHAPWRLSEKSRV